MREKWDLVDYRDSTIAMARERKTEFYQWNGNGNAAKASVDIIVGKTERTEFELSDTGMAERVRAASEAVRYVTAYTTFILWDDRR